jgi:hypothetical protein
MPTPRIPPRDHDHWADICINIIRHYNEGWANGFHLNLDYWHIWEEPAALRTVLDAHGFTQTELHLAEWHYIPDALWGDLFAAPDVRKRAWDTVNGLDSAAFLCATLIGLQDRPIAMANYYVGSTLKWGFYDPYGARNKCYYGMKAFSLLATYENRIAVHSLDGAPRMWALAGRRNSGESAVLVSCLEGPAGPIDIAIEGGLIDPRHVHVLAIDAGRDLEPMDAVQASATGIRFIKPAGAAVILAEFH